MVSPTGRVPPYSDARKGSPQALSSLLRAGAHQALLYAISRFGPTDPAPLCAAFARALRALTVSLAELVGPHHGVFHQTTPNQASGVTQKTRWT